MNKLLRIFMISFIYILVFSTVSFAGFEDVKGHWAEEQINNFFESGFIDGYEDETFRPNREITRAELCKIVNSYMGYEVSGEWKTSNFEIAKEKGYLTNGELDSSITREEAFVVLARAMNISEIDVEINFKDNELIAIWALPSVKSLYFMNYIKGYEDGKLNPKQNITRAEVVSVLYNYIGIGGVDVEPTQTEFSIGYFDYNGYGLEFIEIEEEIEMESGDILTLAATVTAEDDVIFEILEGNELVEFDAETLMLDALSEGEVRIKASSNNEEKEITIIIK